MDKILLIEKSKVYEEVDKTTAYTGEKSEKEGEYERVSTTDENREVLDRFWREGKSGACVALRRILADVGTSIKYKSDDTATPEGVSNTLTSDDFAIQLSLSNSFDTALWDSMGNDLFSYFVMSVAAKWFVFTNKAEAGEYATAAASFLDSFLRKAYFKKKPTRPTYN